MLWGKAIIGDDMKALKKGNLMTALSGLSIGFVNGLLGAGGGIIAVPILKRLGLERKEAHANAVAVILPITLLSAALYLLKGYVSLADSFVFIPGGLVGSLIGTYCLKKISPVWLKRIFGGFMVYAGVRLLLR
ncbi:MAG: TSUP family transporter [Acutalibacteraceae bacterium]